MLQSVAHVPYGRDDPYKTDPDDRFPRDPMAGDTVYIKVMTAPIEPGQTVWVTWTKNGVAQAAVGAAWQSQANQQSFWQAALGPFDRGDQITYQVHANENEANEMVTGSFSFSVTSWSNVTDVLSFKDNGTFVDVVVGDSAGNMTPVLRLGFPTPDSFHLQFSPSGAGLTAGDQPLYHVHDHDAVLNISTSALVLSIQKSPYRLSVFEADGKTLIAQGEDPAIFRNLGWASDGKATVNQIEDHFRIDPVDHFYGFGERYDNYDQRGHDVMTYIYNEYGDQAQTDRTYFASPFFVSSAGYGLYVASTANTVFNVGTFRNDMLGFTVPTMGEASAKLEYYFFAGQPKTVIDRYTALTGRPQLPPKWAFGLWLSANEWHTQGQVTSNLDAAGSNQIPVTVLVLEQWSDEATIYVWHGAEYTAKPGGDALRYGDFTFPPGTAWQDPKAMVADAHGRGVRIVLWQIAALRQTFTTNPTTAPQQHLNDSAYARSKGYLVTDGTGKPYKVPRHSWYGDSLVPDFTNADAAAWWFSKRAYLIDEVGIDGFKNDYGEMVFGRATTFANGQKGATTHDGYALYYAQAYQRFLASKRGADTVVLSRAGTAGSQALSLFWAGDQLSGFDSFRTAVRAGLTAGQSGVAFWGWDMAGFAGNFPSAELYLRAAAMSTFCPIMQLHSQFAPDTMSLTRTPWHVQDVTGDARVIPFFRKFACVRMNLLPYIYSEAKQSALTGAPMMRAMAVEFPADPATAVLDQQYMFGGQLLVAPILAAGATSCDFYVPGGEWNDLWNSGQFAGPATKSYGAGLDMIPVYARPGAVIPLNLDADYQLGGAVGNDVSPPANLTFRIYAGGRSSYPYYDDAAGAVANIEVNASWASRQVTVKVPKLSTAATLQIVASAPGAITVSGTPLPGQATLAAFKATAQGWFWDPVLQATLVKLPAAALPATVTLAEVDKTPYQALFAAGQGTTTNTNHANYTGLGFVDGFDQPGDSVTFSVMAGGGDYWLRFRYANASGADATRTVYVDGQSVATLNLPSLPDWDTWAAGDVAAVLTPGPHAVRVSFDGGDTGVINLNSLTLVATPPSAAVVLTHHNDNRRTGANLKETILDTTNTNVQSFGKRFTYPVLGQVYAQPLYLGGVPVRDKGRHNVVFAATMANRVYAFDADDPLQASTPLWQRKLEPPVTLPDPNIGPTFVDSKKVDTGNARRPDGTPVYRDIADEIGILSTPAISLAHNVMYVVTASHDSSKNGPDAYSHHIHALDLASGEERLGGPVKIQAGFRGQGYTGEHGEQDVVVGGKVQFVSNRHNQRPGLLLVDETLYIAFASYGDKDVYHGWLLGYNAGTLQQTAVFNTTPSALDRNDPDNIGRGGIWQGGEGPAADDQGNVYVLTGNGGYRDETDFGDCFVKLRGSDLKMLDWFAPFNQTALAENDLDVGSAGALILPDTNLLVGGGKESKLFVMRTDNLGKYLPAQSNGQIEQHFYVHPPEDPKQPLKSAAKSDGTGHHIHGSPGYWRGPDGAWIYVWAEDDVVRAYALEPNGKVATTPLTLTGIPNARLGTPSSQGPAVGLAQLSGISPGMPGGALAISANGGAEGTGIVWACHPLANANKATVPGVLRAFDAADVGRELWNSHVNLERDDLGSYAKFCPPTVANGKVYVSTFSNAVVVYGLLDET